MTQGPRSDVGDARAALEGIERASNSLVRALDAGDLVAAGAALDDRQRAVEGLVAALERAGRRRVGPDAPEADETAALRALGTDVKSVLARSSLLEAAVDRARSRAHEGLRAVRCSHRLAQHDRARGAVRPGGWCDVER